MPVTAAVSAHGAQTGAPALTAQGSDRRGARGDHSRSTLDGAAGGHLEDSEAPTAQWLGCISP